MNVIGPHHIIMEFGSAISGDLQGKLMLDLEKHLRQSTGLPIEVFKATMPDDSKLRRSMTQEQREKL